jgi:putative ABC transport system permease protein
VEVRLLGRPGLVPGDFHAEWRPWIVAVSLAVGIGISVAGSFGATRRAARVCALDGLHTVSGDKVMTVGRWAIGLISSAGVIAMIAAATAMGGTSAMNMSVGIALVAVIALSALSPTVVPLVNRLVRVFSRLLFPRSKLGELVHANVGDGVRRSASTAAPSSCWSGSSSGWPAPSAS